MFNERRRSGVVFICTHIVSLYAESSPIIHPLYSADFTSSYFFLFSKLKTDVWFEVSWLKCDAFGIYGCEVILSLHTNGGNFKYNRTYFCLTIWYIKKCISTLKNVKVANEKSTSKTGLYLCLMLISTLWSRFKDK